MTWATEKPASTMRVWPVIIAAPVPARKQIAEATS